MSQEGKHETAHHPILAILGVLGLRIEHGAKPRAEANETGFLGQRQMRVRGACRLASTLSRNQQAKSRGDSPFSDTGEVVTITRTVTYLVKSQDTRMQSPGRKLRDALADGPIMIPGVFNALSAKMAQRIGFQAVYLSGGALSAGWAGLPDIGLLTLGEFAEEAGRLASATDLPLLCDADTGFGEAVNVERTVRLYEKAGAAGLHIEDQVLPKRCGHLSGKTLIPRDAMASKIRAAVASRIDPDFMIVARTDARGVEGLDAAVDRALLYLDAGADMIFPEALESIDEFAEFARRVQAPLLANMTEFGRSPILDFDQLGTLGYRAVLYPLTAFRAAMKAAAETLTVLRHSGHQRQSLDRMQTRAELYDLLGYKDWEDRDQRYFRSTNAPAGENMADHRISNEIEKRLDR